LIKRDFPLKVLILYNDVMKSFDHIEDSYQGCEHKNNEDLIILKQLNRYILAGVFDGVSKSQEKQLGKKIIKDFFINLNEDMENLSIGEIIYKLNENIIIRTSGKYAASFALLKINLNSSDDDEYISFGDTRIYTVGKTFLNQITLDNVLPENNNVIINFLGNKYLERKDFAVQKYKLSEDFDYFICSDGVYKNLAKNIKKFHTVINKKHIFNIKSALEKSLYKKVSDDASFILIRKNV